MGLRLMPWNAVDPIVQTTVAPFEGGFFAV